MIALQVEIDGQPFVTAGAEDWVLLHTILTAMHRAERDEPSHIELQVGGMAARSSTDPGEHLRWPRHKLVVGSSVTITVVDAAEPDPPESRTPSNRAKGEDPFTPEERRQMRWESYKDLKAEFEPDSR